MTLTERDHSALMDLFANTALTSPAFCHTQLLIGVCEGLQAGWDTTMTLIIEERPESLGLSNMSFSKLPAERPNRWSSLVGATEPTAETGALKSSRAQVDTRDMAPTTAPTRQPVSDAGLDAIEAHLLAVTNVAEADWASAKHLTIRLSVDEVRGLVDRIRGSEQG